MQTNCPKCASEDTASFQILIDENSFTSRGGQDATRLQGLARKVHPGQYPVGDIAICMVGTFFGGLFYYYSVNGGPEFTKWAWVMAGIAVIGTPIAYWFLRKPRREWHAKKARIPYGWMCRRCGTDWDVHEA